MGKLNEQQLSNLLIFLDRVEIKGLKELSAMNEIITALQTKQELPQEKPQGKKFT